MKSIFPALLLALLMAQGCSSLKKNRSSAPASASVSRSGSDRNQDYATKFASAAMLEMERDGIPASIILAQGILESGAGTSDLARNANNHFGIKCGNDWNGKTFNKKDDDRDANGNLIESCFRRYNKVEESFNDHGEFLRDPRKEFRYGFLFKLDRTDYKGWAEGLEAAGYSTSNTYSEKLIDIIERYKLYEYDRPADGRPGGILPNPQNPNAGSGTDAQIPLPNPTNRIGRINDTKVVLTREGETITDIAKAYRLNATKVANYNDRGYTPAQKLGANTRIFIQQKKSKWNGRAKEHYVKDAESMFDIAQLYGVRLDKLLEYNRISPGQEPATGERVRLKGKRPLSDNLKLREAGDPTPNQTGSPYPTPPTSETLEPDTEGYLDPIGEEQAKPDQPAKPNLPPDMKPPVVTGTPYPPDPVPNQPTMDQPSGQPNQPGIPQTKPQGAGTGYHVVVKGDTLFNISRRYNTTVAKLKQLNNLSDDTVKIGQTLRVQ